MMLHKGFSGNCSKCQKNVKWSLWVGTLKNVQTNVRKMSKVDFGGYPEKCQKNVPRDPENVKNMFGKCPGDICRSFFYIFWIPGDICLTFLRVPTQIDPRQFSDICLDIF